MRWSVLLLILALISLAGWSEEPDLDRVMQSYVTALGGEEKVRQNTDPEENRYLCVQRPGAPYGRLAPSQPRALGYRWF